MLLQVIVFVGVKYFIFLFFCILFRSYLSTPTSTLVHPMSSCWSGRVAIVMGAAVLEPIFFDEVLSYGNTCAY